MQFLVKAYDGKGMLEKRMEVRPRHLEGMKALGKQVIVAGGLLDESGKMKGSAEADYLGGSHGLGVDAYHPCGEGHCGRAETCQV